MNYEQEIKKLEAQIEEAEAQIQVLKTVVEVKEGPPPVWKPDLGEEYYVVDDDYVALPYPWRDDRTDNYLLKRGAVFKSEEEAMNDDRAMKLIETIRRERFKAQGKWWPGEYETRYTMWWHQPEKVVNILHRSTLLSPSAFGFWQNRDALQTVVTKYESQLKWYFTECLPSIN